MNRTFKVAKSLTRGTVVTSEKASSYQGKAVKTVVAAAVAALVAGTAAAATTAADDLILGADGSLTKNKANVTAVVTGTAYTTVDGKQVAWDGTKYSHTGTTAVKLQGGKIVVDATGVTEGDAFAMGKGAVTGTGTIAVTADTKAATLQAKGGLDLTKADITLAGSKVAASVVAKDDRTVDQNVSLKEGSINFTSGTGVVSGSAVTLGTVSTDDSDVASTTVALNVSKDVAATVSATGVLSLTNVTFSNAGTLTLKGDTVALGSAFDAAANTGKTVFDGATTVSKSFKGTVVELNTANKADKASQQVFTGNVTVNADAAFSADKLTVAANKLTNNGTLTAADAVFTNGEEHALAGKNTFGTLAIGNTAANAKNAVKVTSTGTLAVTDTVTLKGNTASTGLATLNVTDGTATLAKANVADFGVLSTSGQAALTVSDTLTVAGSAAAKTASVTLGGKSAQVANLVVNAYGTAAVSGGEVALDNVKVGNNGSVSVTGGDVTLGKLELAAAVTTPAAAPAGKFEVTGGTLTTEGANLFSYDATKTGLDKQVSLKGGVSFAGATLVLTDSTFNGKAIEYTVADYNTLLGKLGKNSDLQLLNGTLISKTADGKTAQASINEAAQVGYTGKTAVAWKYGKAAAEFTNGTKDLTVGSVNFAPAEGSTVKLTSAKIDANQNTVAFLSDAQGKVFTGAVDKDNKDVAITLTNGTFAFGDEDGQANVGTVTNKVVLEGATTVYDDFTFGDVELKGGTLTVAGKLSANDITRSAQETTTVQNGATLVLAGKAPSTKAAGDPQTVEAAVTLANVAATSKKGGLFVVGAQNLANAQALAAEAGRKNVVYVGQAVNFKGGVTGAQVLGIDLASVVKSGYKATAENAIVTGVTGTNSLVVDGLKEVGKSGLVYNAKMDGYYVNSGLQNLTSVDFGTDLYTFDAVGGHAYVVVDELAVKELEALGLNSEGAVKQALNNIEFGQNEIADQFIFDIFGTTTTNAYLVAAHKAWAEYQAELEKAGKWPDDEDMRDVLEQEFFAPYLEQLVNAEHAATNMAALGGVFTTTLDVNDQVTAAVNRRTSAARVTGFTPWVDVFGTSNEAKRLYGSDAGYEADIYGAVLGFDYTAKSGTTVGLAVNVGQADGNSVGSGAKVDNDADFYGVSVYGAQTLGDFNLKADFGYTQVSNELSTSNVLGSYKESLDSDVLTFGVGAEYLAKFGALSVTPHAGIRLNRISIDDSKFGASYDDMTVYQLPLGVAFSGTFDVNGWKLAPVVDLSVVPTFGDKDAVATYTGGITNTTRVVDTNPLQAKLGVEAQNGAWAFGLNYGLTAGGEDRLNNALNANVRYSF